MPRAEPIGKRYLKYEAPNPAYGLGVAINTFVWAEIDGDEKEVFTTPLDKPWKPHSIGRSTSGGHMLVGAHVLHVSEDDALWIAKLPNGKFEKTAVVWEGILDNADDGERIVSLDSANLKLLRVSKNDGQATVTTIPPLPPTKGSRGIQKLIAAEPSRLLVWAWAQDEVDGNWENSKHLYWLDLPTGQWTEVKEAEANGGYITAKVEGSSTSESYEVSKSPRPRCSTHKFSQRDFYRLICKSNSEGIGPVQPKASSWTDGAWAVWQETWGPEEGKKGFFVAQVK